MLHGGSNGSKAAVRLGRCTLMAFNRRAKARRARPFNAFSFCAPSLAALCPPGTLLAKMQRQAVRQPDEKRCLCRACRALAGCFACAAALLDAPCTPCSGVGDKQPGWVQPGCMKSFGFAAVCCLSGQVRNRCTAFALADPEQRQRTCGALGYKRAQCSGKLAPCASSGRHGSLPARYRTNEEEEGWPQRSGSAAQHGVHEPVRLPQPLPCSVARYLAHQFASPHQRTAFSARPSAC